MKGLRVYSNIKKVGECYFLYFTNWIKKNKFEAVMDISTLIPATNIIQHLVMIITIVKYSEYIYVILMTQIEGIQVFFYNLTLNFQNCGPFKFLRERQFSSERPF